ncbi:MAG: dihydropteroate synthase [Clostridiales bacterium]|mgnify:FL=1|nr:dihydropteroate synthase [Clostridiales bacterium]
MIIGNKSFETGKAPYIMGILNVTPDSFSDGGQHNTMDTALATTEKMIAEGAAIIDVGGESTRPGYTKISDDEEIERTAPIIEAIKKRFDIAVSLDTYKSGVAEAGIQAGADLINDIWGLKYDDRMAGVIAKYDKACCLMHNRDNVDYKDYLADVVADLDESVNMALAAGIDRNKIMVDPGIGFAKDLHQNLLLMNNLELLHKWNLPILLGTSRKSMIGLTLDLPVTEREEGTIATSVLGLVKGCDFFRVHNVEANYRALKMTYAMLSVR